MKAIGLMSGTSLDGIDVALIETDGESVSRFGPGRTYPYTEEDRQLFFRALEEAVELDDRTARPGTLRAAEILLTTRHADAVAQFLSENPVEGGIDVIGFHGQTVLHRPEERLTVQLGDGARLIEALRPLAGANVRLVHDFRAADVAAGGQGAPFVPAYHRALARALDRPQPLMVLNLGGVANITFIDGGNDPVACDTGPANALIDDFLKERTGEAFDREGAAAAAGTIDEAAVERLLRHGFFRLSPPKSLDRNAFRAWVAEQVSLDDMSTEDGAATLTALTAASVAAILPLLPRRPESVIAAGGGAHNPTLLRMLGERLGVEVVSADAVGWSADFLEAQAFGFLAVRSLRGLPLSFPTTTGVPEPMTGGVHS